jgi:hypothetical protein
LKSLLLIGAMIVATGTCAFAQRGYWVVGNRATSKCEIVTSNPVINAQVGGNIWFGSGPYQSTTTPGWPVRPSVAARQWKRPPAKTPDDEDKSN